jgi:Tfp pilus assembly protein PilF
MERRREAAMFATALIGLQPESWRSHWLLGQVLEQQDPDAAATAYERSLALNAEQPKVHRFLAIHAARMARPRETLEHLRGAQPRAADDVEIVLAEAKARLLLGELARARALLNQTIAVVGVEDPRIWTLKGRIELDQHGPAEAAPWLEKAAARMPHVPETVDAMIALAAHRGDADQVRLYNRRKQEYTKAGEEAKVLSKKMDALYRQANADAAEVEATAFRLGQLMFLIAHDEAGVKWMQSVLATNPRHAGAHHALAEYYERIGAGRPEIERFMKHSCILGTTAGPAAAFGDRSASADRNRYREGETT